MIIQKNGRRCKCGKNGCFEAYASMKVFKTQIRKRFNNEKMSSKEILELLKDESNLKIAEDIIKEYIEYVAIGVSNFARICSADTVAIGGSFIYFKDILFDRLLQELDRIMIPMEKENTSIKIAILGNDAGIIGATKIQ
jgi:predicted NBD/HSP70 family sugar kinase